MSDQRGDTRIKFVIGTKRLHPADDEVYPRGLAFDHHRGLLFIIDTKYHRVQVFSSNDGSFVSKFGSHGNQAGEFFFPSTIAIDHEHHRILVSDCNNNRVHAWSLKDLSFQSFVGHHEPTDCQFRGPTGVTIDHHRHRVIVVDACNHRLVVLSSIDLSFLFAIGGREGHQPGEFHIPSRVAIDHDRDRIIVVDSGNHRVQVLSSIDGSFLFEFGSHGNQPGQFNYPYGVSIINQGRIIVADTYNLRLQAFTPEGHHISSFICGNDVHPVATAFDPYRGLIAFSSRTQVHVIEADRWLPDTSFIWQPDRHLDAPEPIKQAVQTLTMIRSLVHESSLSLLPNELLFLIFEMLAPEADLQWKFSSTIEAAPQPQYRPTAIPKRAACAMM